MMWIRMGFSGANGLKKQTTNGATHCKQGLFSFELFKFHDFFYEFFKFAMTLGLALTKKIFKNILAGISISTNS